MTLPTIPMIRRPMSPWKVGVIVFFAATCLKVWTGGTALVADARAQIPNPGQQRQELVAEIRRTNQLLTDILALLKSGTLHVRAESADNQPD